MSKKIYTAFSFYQFILIFALKLCCVFGLIYALAHYNENPVLVMIAAAIFFLFIFFVGEDQIVVYDDKIIQKTNSFFDLISRSKGRKINIKEIRSAYLETTPKPQPAEIAGALLVSLAAENNRSNRDKALPVYFDLKNGETVKFESNLEYTKLKRIVEIVNDLVK